MLKFSNDDTKKRTSNAEQCQKINRHKTEKDSTDSKLRSTTTRTSRSQIGFGDEKIEFLDCVFEPRPLRVAMEAAGETAGVGDIVSLVGLYDRDSVPEC